MRNAWRAVMTAAAVFGTLGISPAGFDPAARAAGLEAGATIRPATVDGVREPVDVLRDRWGVNHIYARNEHDLFFVQGYTAARDRLFQFELWRRQATGTVAEILGRKELARDI